MANGPKVVARALSYEGVAEDPPHSNSSPDIDRWQARVGLLGLPAHLKPWCGTFVSAMYAEAGVDDSGLAHPSTAVMCSRARSIGAIDKRPRPGAIIIWCGTHTGILVAPTGTPGVWHTIEGNSGDRVARRVRDLSAARVIVPPALNRDPIPGALRNYYLEDAKATYRLHPGRWLKRAYAEKAAKALGGIVRQTWRGSGDDRVKVYVVRLGEPRHYGPWLSSEDRERAKAILERRLGRRLRPYSMLRDPIRGGSAESESLGRTV